MLFWSSVPTRDDSDARIVARTIASESLCVPCIVRRTGVAKARVERIVMLSETVKVTRDVVVCDGCLLTREVFRLV